MRTNDTGKFQQASGSSDECLPIDELVMAIEGELGNTAQTNAESHLAGCPFCEAELALFRTFESHDLRPEEVADVEAIAAQLRKTSPVPVSTRWWKGIWNFKILAPASIAAAAVLAFAFFVPRAQDPRPGTFSADDTLRSSRIEARSPIGNVNAVPYVLEWNALKGASKYRVRLFEVDNTQLWKTEVQTPRARMPDHIRQLIIPRKKLNWRVTAFDHTGNPVADSGTESFTLAAVQP